MVFSRAILCVCTALLCQLPCILEHLHNLKVGGNLAQNSLSAGSLPNSFYPVDLTCSSAPPLTVSTTLVQSPRYFSMDARGCGGSEPWVCWAGLQSAARGPGLPSDPALPATVLGAAVLGCWGLGLPPGAHVQEGKDITETSKDGSVEHGHGCNPEYSPMRRVPTLPLAHCQLR